MSLLSLQVPRLAQCRCITFPVVSCGESITTTAVLSGESIITSEFYMSLFFSISLLYSSQMGEILLEL